jgi:hypothetical protein
MRISAGTGCSLACDDGRRDQPIVPTRTPRPRRRFAAWQRRGLCHGRPIHATTHDESGGERPESTTQEGLIVTGLSRRSFIGGAAAVVTAASVPGVAAAASPADDELPETDAPLLARVRDVRTGELTLYVGSREISHTDPTLARRLARAAR